MSVRKGYLSGFFLVVGLLLAAVYLQLHENILPCPLCIMQRYVFVALAAVYFLAGIKPWSRTGNRFWALAAILICLVGVLLAGRQTWLQHFPPTDTGECTVSMAFLFQTLPWQDALIKIFTGGTECAQSVWSLFSLSLAEWSLLSFIAFACFSAYQYKKSAAT